MRTSSKLMASLAALALVAGSTTAAAASPMAAQPQAPNAWMMLSVLGPARSVALGGANTAAQPADLLPPPPPAAAGAGAGLGITGELLPVLLWFGLIAIALTSSGSNGRPNTPP